MHALHLQIGIVHDFREAENRSADRDEGFALFPDLLETATEMLLSLKGEEWMQGLFAFIRQFCHGSERRIDTLRA